MYKVHCIIQSFMIVSNPTEHLPLQIFYTLSVLKANRTERGRTFRFLRLKSNHKKTILHMCTRCCISEQDPNLSDQVSAHKGLYRWQ